jgi:Interferon-induced transmembrane protein
MFCGNCGSTAVEGDHYCVRCGREQGPTSTSRPMGAPPSGGPGSPAEMTNPAKVATGATATLVKSVERPLYCRHSPSERSALGRQGQDGSEICTGCQRPYAPGSPGSGLRSAAVDPARMSSAPPNHLTWAILSLIFFFWPLGIPAIVFANRVNDKWIAGDIDGAQSASQSAKDFATWATVAGSIIYFLSFIYFFAVMGAVAGSLP